MTVVFQLISGVIMCLEIRKQLFTALFSPDVGVGYGMIAGSGGRRWTTHGRHFSASNAKLPGKATKVKSFRHCKAFFLNEDVLIIPNLRFPEKQLFFPQTTTGMLYDICGFSHNSMV